MEENREKEKCRGGREKEEVLKGTERKGKY